MKKKLTDSQGRTFLTIAHDQERGCVWARWQGEQTIETVRLGSIAIVELVVEKKVTKLLNISSQITGPWFEVNDWVAQSLTPQALAAGLQYFAYVVPPGLEGKLSVVDLHQRIGHLVQMKIFLETEEAENWLNSSVNPAKRIRLAFSYPTKNSLGPFPDFLLLLQTGLLVGFGYLLWAKVPEG